MRIVINFQSDTEEWEDVHDMEFPKTAKVTVNIEVTEAKPFIGAAAKAFYSKEGVEKVNLLLSSETHDKLMEVDDTYNNARGSNVQVVLK